MAWLAASLIASVLVSGAALWWIMDALGVAPGEGLQVGYADAVAPVLSLIAAMLAFGFVSRCFERQSDAYAARHLSGDSPTITTEAANTMIQALIHVAHSNRVPRNRWTWRHGSIAGRIAHLRTLVGQPVSRLAIDREARMVKIATAVVFASGVVLAMVVA
jgi:Zn-dependent protease with chaperone function